MKYPNKTNVAVASNKRTTIPLDSKHITTADFMQLNVSKCMELVPKQSIDLQHYCFARLEPLPVPTFGDAQIRHKAFWVPYRTIMPAWNDFINDVPHTYNDGTSDLVNNVPIITNDVFCEFFELGTVSTSLDDLSSGAVADIKGRQFTKFGLWAYKIIRSLGYSPIYYPTSEQPRPINVPPYSAMPILALIKIYLDWYYTSQYANSDIYDILNGYLVKNDVISPTASFINAEELYQILFTISTIYYDSDYFTSAWDNPNGPNAGLSSDISIRDITATGFSPDQYDRTPSVSSGYTENGTPLISSTLKNITYPVSQFALNSLRALTDYMKRHQIVGSRALDRYLSRWGVKLSSEKLTRSVLVTEYEQNIMFGDVTSTSDTEGASLGSFAGKGISSGNGSINFDTNGEFGLFVILTHISPKIDYYQGIDRNILNLTKLDFYTPEFDNLGTQPISNLEVYAPVNITNEGVGGASILNTYANGVFGFAPRYAQYKKPFSLVTGDYLTDSTKLGKEAWTLFRDLRPATRNGFLSALDLNLTHSLNFVSSSDSAQYNRIFYLPLSRTEHFNLIHEFVIKTSFPGSGLYDNYEFKDEEKSQHVTVDVGGTTVH